MRICNFWEVIRCVFNTWEKDTVIIYNQMVNSNHLKFESIEVINLIREYRRKPSEILVYFANGEFSQHRTTFYPSIFLVHCY